ncbi:ribonuclease H-like protein [Penicillium odoratum]|uniref:ribonuclease H-like protein n=1 Tax=Penicillium odoratum TaxID=1167516 RepID=UPI002546EEC7|nr:ribonuclease H-like protein [Penicillium odoratum]KAJ5772605.1 ribonuclease H-like protein [Penicillium odoratum]
MFSQLSHFQKQDVFENPNASILHPIESTSTLPQVNYYASPPAVRFINVNDPAQFLIYTDGSCLDNVGPTSRAGCAIVYGEHGEHFTGCNGFAQSPSFEFRLGTRGQSGVLYPQTSNRAELRAVIAALRYREWTFEGFNSLVIATDSSYVVNGITSGISEWQENGWRTSAGHPVLNRDLWQFLLSELKNWGEDGLSVEFW